MASYDFIINCYHQNYTINVHPKMSFKDIIQNICHRFNLVEDSFYLEIYDEQISSYVDCTEDYQNNLRQRLPTLQQKTILGRITFFNKEIKNENYHSSDTSIQYPVDASAMEDEQQNMDVNSMIDSQLVNFSDSIENQSIDSVDETTSTEYIIFERDVIPYEKDYNSIMKFGKDRFVKRIQGLKNSQEERFGYLLPEIKIPSLFVRKNQSKLLIAVVLQELNGSQVQWRLHKFKGFLPNGVGTDSKSFNPFYLNINQLEMTANNTYELPLRICNLRETQDSLKADQKIFHTLSKDEVLRRHLAEHTYEVPRLVCVMINENNTPQWSTFGLSNFIRPIPIETPTNPNELLDMDDTMSDISDVSINSTENTQVLFDNLSLQQSCTNMTTFSTKNSITFWLDPTIDFASSDYLNSFTRLQRCTNVLKTYTDPNECFDFLSDIYDKSVFLIISGSLGQNIIPLIHDISQLNLIFIFCQNESNYKQLTKDWSKVQGIFTEITYLCLSLKQKIEQDTSNDMPMTCISQIDLSYRNLNKLDSSFMYSQILKEILLEIDYNEQSYIDLCEYLRHQEQFANDLYTLKSIDKFEKEYRERSPIWWYTSFSFIYRLLNQSLRLLDIDTTIKMGVFIRDLYNEIKRLYSDQIKHVSVDKFIVYRGQSLLKSELNKLSQNIGGLISFNSFLSTSVDREVAHLFAENHQNDSDSIGVIFKINIDSSIASTRYASIKNLSYYDCEEEVLFCMHAVFRIHGITNIDSNLWQVKLTLTNDNDSDLDAVTERIREETFSELKGWHRLGMLLIKIGYFDKSERLYQLLLNESFDHIEKMNIYSQLGIINSAKGYYDAAIDFYNKALQIAELDPSSDAFSLASKYNNIAQVYLCINDYKNARKYCEKALKLEEENSTSIHLNLANSYVKMGLIYHNMADYKNAILYFEKTLQIQLKLLPSHHPDIGECYNSIGYVYEKVGEYSKALSFFEKSLDIRLKILPQDHPDLASSYRSIGSIYLKRSEYHNALNYYQKSLSIQQRSLPLNHPDLASTFNDIGRIYKDMGHYLEALSFYMKALTIQEQSLPSNHPDLASSYNNMGTIYSDMGDYSQALLNYQKALVIYQQSLPLNHPDLSTSYSNIGVVYCQIKNYTDALSCFKNALEIRRQILPSNHPDLASLYNNIGTVHNDMHNHSKALFNYEKALKIYQQSLPSNHPSLSTSYNNIGVAYFQMNNYIEALANYEKALKIYKESLPPTHPDLSISYNNIGIIYEKMNDYVKACSMYEKAVHISEHSLPTDHPFVKNYKNNLDRIKEKLKP